MDAISKHRVVGVLYLIGASVCMAQASPDADASGSGSTVLAQAEHIDHGQDAPGSSTVYPGDMPWNPGAEGRLSERSALTTHAARTEPSESPIDWGEEGHFDGVSGSYSLWPEWRVSGVFGKPSEALRHSNRYFYGAAIDTNALGDDLEASAFLTQRMIDGQIDRRAVGTELRYTLGDTTTCGKLDYDLSMRILNVASLEWEYSPGEEANGSTFSALIENKAQDQAALADAMTMSFSHLAFPGAPPQTMSELKQQTGYSSEQLRSLVRANTPRVAHGMTSMATQVSTAWRVGVEVHLSHQSAIAPNFLMPEGQAANGRQWKLGLHASTKDFLLLHDKHTFSSTFTTDPHSSSAEFVYSSALLLSRQWQIEPNLRLQRSAVRDLVTGTRSRHAAAGPALKTKYRPKKSWTVESNVSFDYAHGKSALPSDRVKTYSYAYAVALRYGY